MSLLYGYCFLNSVIKSQTKILVFGFGKVGSGIVHYALKYGAFVTVVADFSDGFPEKENENVQFIHLKYMRSLNN